MGYRQMTNIDQIIRTQLNIEDKSDIKLCIDAETNKINTLKVNEIVNNFIPQIENCHDINLEKTLKEDGIVVLENFLSENEVDEVLSKVIKEPGYNYHISATAYNRETRTIDNAEDWNILSYEPSLLFQSSVLLNKITNTSLLSLIQSYLGCFPTIFSLNCLWSIYNQNQFKTQTTHRDYDDFKFLSLFILLTDIDETNGPHVYYPKTHDGSEISSEPKVVYGKKGTAFIADVYGLHNGMPLQQGSRCFLWCRFGLFLNNMHFYIKNNLYIQDENTIFSKIEKNKYNEYLLRGYIK
jgi:hypothetical protein